MLSHEKWSHRLGLLLYGLAFSLLVFPWAYYDVQNVAYSFLPRRFLFLLLGLVALLIATRNKISYRQILLGFFFALLGLFHWQLKGYMEPHYFLEFAYLEIALLILFSPTEVKEKMLKYSSVLLYLVLIRRCPSLS